MSTRLVVGDLACRRGERVLFTDLSFDLAAGDLVWLRAANGHGKTTLLRAIAGIGQHEAGTIAWTDAAAPPLYLAHANALKDDLTVVESLRHVVALHGLAASTAAVEEAIERFGMHARRDAPIRTLSQGQRRRVALMRLCLSDARTTWLLDEPFDALDDDGSALVGSLIADHATRGGSVLLTSHSSPPLPAGTSLRTIRLDGACP